jgi:hypothetical protein
MRPLRKPVSREPSGDSSWFAADKLYWMRAAFFYVSRGIASLLQRSLARE